MPGTHVSELPIAAELRMKKICEGAGFDPAALGHAGAEGALELYLPEGRMVVIRIVCPA